MIYSGISLWCLLTRIKEMLTNDQLVYKFREYLVKIHDGFRSGNQRYILGRTNIKLHLTAGILVCCKVIPEISTKRLVLDVRIF
jgi:hypothetical protein